MEMTSVRIFNFIFTSTTKNLSKRIFK